MVNGMVTRWGWLLLLPLSVAVAPPPCQNVLKTSPSASSLYQLEAKSTSITSDEAVNVVLKSAGSGDPFKGYLMVAFDDANNRPIGTFSQPSDGHVVDCFNGIQGVGLECGRKCGTRSDPKIRRRYVDSAGRFPWRCPLQGQRGGTFRPGGDGCCCDNRRGQSHIGIDDRDAGGASGVRRLRPDQGLLRLPEALRRYARLLHAVHLQEPVGHPLRAGTLRPRCRRFVRGGRILRRQENGRRQRRRVRSLWGLCERLPVVQCSRGQPSQSGQRRHERHRKLVRGGQRLLQGDPRGSVDCRQFGFRPADAVLPADGSRTVRQQKHQRAHQGRAQRGAHRLDAEGNPGAGREPAPEDPARLLHGDRLAHLGVDRHLPAALHEQDLGRQAAHGQGPLVLLPPGADGVRLAADVDRLRAHLHRGRRLGTERGSRTGPRSHRLHRDRCRLRAADRRRVPAGAQRAQPQVLQRGPLAGRLPGSPARHHVHLPGRRNGRHQVAVLHLLDPDGPHRLLRPRPLRPDGSGQQVPIGDQCRRRCSGIPQAQDDLGCAVDGADGSDHRHHRLHRRSRVPVRPSPLNLSVPPVAIFCIKTARLLFPVKEKERNPVPSDLAV